MKKTIVSSIIIVSFILYAILRNKSTADALPLANSSAISSDHPSSNQKSLSLKDGEFTGDSIDAYYGYIQVKAVIKNRKLTDITFLKYPSDHRRSIEINTIAMPVLKQEAITAQSANVDTVTGATDTSKAFIESLSSALLKAQV
jgi:uncharacterized protein with FMN-binding domain